MAKFQIKNKQMLFWRLGAMSSVKQKHFGDKAHHQPPTSRGIWCFPFPYYDYFFCWHQWESKLPKKFRSEIGKEDKKVDFDSMTDEEAEVWHKEKENAMKKVKALYKPRTFWYGGKFYSHISDVHGIVNYDKWFLWENVTDWEVEARKHLFVNERSEHGIFRMEYSKDHLEIFIPNFK